MKFRFAFIMLLLASAMTAFFMLRPPGTEQKTVWTPVRNEKDGYTLDCPDDLGILFEDRQVSCAFGTVRRASVTVSLSIDGSARELVERVNARGFVVDAVAILGEKEIDGLTAVITETKGASGRDLRVVKDDILYALHSELPLTQTERFFSSFHFIE